MKIRNHHGQVRFLFFLALLAVGMPAVADLLLHCPPKESDGGDFNDRGFYVSGYPGTSIDTVTLWLSDLNVEPMPRTVRLEARLGAYDGPLVASSQLAVNLSLTDSEVVFPMADAMTANPPVPAGSTLCFLLSDVLGPAAAVFYYNNSEVSFIDYPDATDPCPHVVQTSGTTPPLDSFRRDAVAISVTGDLAGEFSGPARPAYCHESDAGNTSGHITEIDHPALNGNPSALLFICSNRSGTVNNQAVGVWYNGSSWTIYNENFALMPAGAIFNVLAFNAADGVFRHRTEASNVNGNVTTLDHPFLNGNPDARPIVTHDWTIGATYQTHNTGVRYDSDAERWTIFNQDSIAISEGLNYNVHADPSGAHTLVHVTTLDNLTSDGLRSAIDHPLLNNRPDAKIALSHAWNGSYLDTPFGVVYDTGRWHILREDGGPLPANQRFHVLVGTSIVQSRPLAIEREGDQVKLWINHPCAGPLEHSTDLQAPWLPIEPPSNPFTFPALDRDFFRLSVLPDPAVVSVAASIVHRDTAFTGRIRITAIVRNLTGGYESNPGQQQLILYEHPLGGSSSVAAQQDFTWLPSGEFVAVSIEREWYRGNEFPPEYIATVAYEPDILSDGNVHNDDCHTNNNSRSLSGYDIHKLFD